MKKDKIFAVVSIAVFMAVLVLPSVLWLCVSTTLSDSQGTFDYDLGENRNKAAFPETFSMTYMQEVEEYYNDRLPFRSVIISVNREMNSFMEGNYDILVVPYLAKLVHRGVEPAVEEPTTLQGMTENTKQQEVLAAADTKQEAAEETTAEEEKDSVKDGGLKEQETSAETVETDGKGTEGEETEGEKTEGKETEGEEIEGEVKAEEAAALVNEDAAYLMPKIHNDSVIEGSDKWLFFMLENSLEDYQGSNVFNEA